MADQTGRRSFEDINRQLRLKKFLDSPLGTLYLVPASPGSTRLIARRFDRELEPSLIAPYVGLIRACSEWVQRWPALRAAATIQLPTEVGVDFVARPHHTYVYSTDSYADNELGLDIPDQLALMRQALRESLDAVRGERDEVVATVLTRSLIEPTHKTYLGDDDRFIVVEPKMTPEDVKAWGDCATREVADDRGHLRGVIDSLFQGALKDIVALGITFAPEQAGRWQFAPDFRRLVLRLENRSLLLDVIEQGEWLEVAADGDEPPMATADPGEQPATMSMGSQLLDHHPHAVPVRRVAAFGAIPHAGGMRCEALRLELSNGQTLFFDPTYYFGIRVCGLGQEKAWSENRWREGGPSVLMVEFEVPPREQR